MRIWRSALCILSLVASWAIFAQAQKPERSIEQMIGGLRSQPHDVRASQTRDLAKQIGALPASARKVQLAASLANLSTEGDFGADTLQAVTDTLAGALKENPQKADDYSYEELAQLARFEQVKVDLPGPEYAAAVAKLNALEKQRTLATFTLKDLDGKTWRLDSLRGKVVVVNFWATWCPPCRAEMPDLEALYNEYKNKGLVVLAITDEDAEKTVKPFIAKQGYTFPILIDEGRKVNDAYAVSGIPRSFIYDRKGKLSGEAMDMRTREQLLRLLATAGLK